MKKMMILLSVLIISLIIHGCSQQEIEKEQEETMTVEMQKPDDFEMPEFPDNPFAALGVEEPDLGIEDSKKPMKTGDKDIKHLSVRMFRFGFDPEIIEVSEGDEVHLTVFSADVGHGFALPDYGINKKIAPEESVDIVFTADHAGEFEFFESVYCGKGWKDMKGTLVVK